MLRDVGGRLFPRPLRLLSAGVLVVGAASVLSAIARIGLGTPMPEVWEFAAAFLLFAVGDIPIVHVRLGHDRCSFTWSEVAMIVGLALLSGPWLVLAAGTGVAVSHLAARRAPIKVAFNALLFAAGALLAEVVFGWLNGAPAALSHDVRPLISLAVAGVMFSVASSFAVAAAVAFSQQVPVRVLYRKAYGLRLLVCLGNVTIGIAVVFMASLNPATLVVLPLFLGLLYLSYSSFLRAMQERDVWADLQAASGDLVRLDQAAVSRAVIERAQSLFSAEFVEVLLVDGVPGTRATAVRLAHGDVTEQDGAPLAIAGGYWPRAHAEREPFVVRACDSAEVHRADLAEHGLVMCVVAPLLTQHGCIGALRLGFRGQVRLRSRELLVLSTYANYVATSLDNARLFESVAAEQARLAGILDNTSDGIFSVDASGAVQSWNPAMARLTGVPAEQAIGRPVGLGMDTEAAERIGPEWVSRMLSEDTSRSLVVGSEDGRQRWLELRVSGVSAVGDESPGAVVVVRDVTSQREADEAKQDFLATVSHELRTPLTSLRGWLTTILHPDFRPGPDETREINERMLHQTTRLQRLIEDLLNASTLDRGDEFDVDTEAVQVDEVVRRALLDLVQHSSRPTRQIRGGPAMIARADAGRLEQVIGNLLANADKYCPSGIPVVVAVERSGDDILISVSDGGPGIPENAHEVIFDRFTRLGNHLTREVPGTGLGLHIARRLVETMGGRIWVESSPGAGATFRFTLPAVHDSVALGQLPAPRGTSTLSV